MASTNQINKVVELIVVLGDLIILNFCLFLLLFYWEKAFNSLPFSCTASLMMTSLSLCYLACSASRGRAWNSREIRADQLVLRVLKNVITFSVFWACIMAFSGISIISPLFFVLYFFILFVILSIYRIIIRHLLISYCAKGKHKRYAVFIGGGNNMQMLYEEMESSLASIYEVVGYFDIKPNDVFSSQCSYCGSPDGFSEFMSGHTGIKHVFCSLSMEEGRYNFSIMNYCAFNSIGTAVMWGRSLYKNIQRFIVFQLTINFVALLIVLLGSVIGTELPLTVTQMLWVNLIMDTFAALALASIPPSETVMLEKPRRSTDFIISKAMRSNIIGVGSIFLIVLLGMIYYFDHSTQGMNVHNLTIFFTFFVMLQFWNLFNARVFGTTNSAFKGLSKSYGMELIVLAILAGQFLIVQFGGAVFRTEPLDWQTWLLIIGVSSTVLWVGELVRLVQRIIHKKDRNEK